MKEWGMIAQRGTLRGCILYRSQDAHTLDWYDILNYKGQAIEVYHLPVRIKALNSS